MSDIMFYEKFSCKGFVVMKKIVFSLFFIVLFIGCGGSSKTEEVTNNVGTPSVNDELSSVNSDDTERKIQEEEVTVELTGFAKVRDLIKKSRDGDLTDVTYLCVGDSTRAESEEDQAHRMFERVKATLDTYNVDSILLARGSQELAHFLEIKLENSHVRTPTYQDVISATPGTGSTTIVDFALGINDLWDLNIASSEDMADAVVVIKDRLLQSIELVQLSKPDVSFVLTSPSPLLDWGEGSEIYATVYKEVSQELELPFINYVDDLMPARSQDMNASDITEFASWYRLESGVMDPIHLSEYGLNQVADYILENILPTE